MFYSLFRREYKNNDSCVVKYDLVPALLFNYLTGILIIIFAG